MSTTETELTIQKMDVTLSIPKQRISDLLCCALEGGSNYWYEIKTYTVPPALGFQMDKERIYRHLDYPLNEGGSLLMATNEGDEIGGKKEWSLDLEAIKRGLVILWEKYPQQFAEFLAENEDSDTGDIFLQCCLFGSVELG